MNRWSRIVLSTALVFVPATTSAQVVVSEFVYDAPGTDTGQEWVELYNGGSSAVDISKWKVSDGSNHVFNAPPKNGGTGVLSIPAGGYVILADDAAAFVAAHPSVAVSVIDTTISLSNTGGTLSLVDGSQTPNVTVDSIAYTKDLGAAGDGNSLQKNGSTWITALPTPGIANATVAAPPATTDTGSGSSASTSTGETAAKLTPVSSYVAPPVPQIFADGGDDRTVIVGADTEFSGRAYDRSQEIVDLVRFSWNFGDGSTEEGQSVLHHFDYPGKYAVILNVAHNRSAMMDKIVVTAVPAKLGFTVNADGSVVIANESGRDLDLSHWIIKSFARQFILPDYSVLLAGESLRINSAKLNFSVSSDAELQYPNGVLALHAGEHTTTAESNASQAPSPASTPASAPVSSTAAVADAIRAAAPQSNAPVTVKTTEVPVEGAQPDIASSSEFDQTAAVGATGGSMWWLAALGLALFVSAGAYLVARAKRGEWDIVEHSE